MDSITFTGLKLIYVRKRLAPVRENNEERKSEEIGLILPTPKWWREHQWVGNDGMDFDQTTFPDSKVHGANMGPIWGRQDPGGPHVGHMNLVIWVGWSYKHT